MTIFTHFSVDLDAVASVWFTRKFVPGFSEAGVVFKPANWDGSEMAAADIAVDINAGGKGFKGIENPDGTVSACFKGLLTKHGSGEVRTALDDLAGYIDAHDSQGNAFKFLAPDLSEGASRILGAASLNVVLRAIQATNPRNDGVVVEKMGEIFNGILEMNLAKTRAVAEADRAELFGGGVVALVENSREFGTNGILFDQGVQAVIYVDGNNLGAIRAGSCQVRMDCLAGIVEAAGESADWFGHPAGFLYCRGSRKAPAETPSAVDPRELAEALVKIIKTPA